MISVDIYFSGFCWLCGKIQKKKCYTCVLSTLQQKGMNCPYKLNLLKVICALKGLHLSKEKKISLWLPRNLNQGKCRMRFWGSSSFYEKHDAGVELSYRLFLNSIFSLQCIIFFLPKWYQFFVSLSKNCILNSGVFFIAEHFACYLS